MFITQDIIAHAGYNITECDYAPDQASCFVILESYIAKVNHL